MNFIGHIEKYLKNSEFFIDIGSHSGAYLEIAKKQMKKGIIYSFEPNSFRMSKLKKLKLYFLNTNVKINYFSITTGNFKKSLRNSINYKQFIITN